MFISFICCVFFFIFHLYFQNLLAMNAVGGFSFIFFSKLAQHLNSSLPSDHLARCVRNRVYFCARVFFALQRLSSLHEIGNALFISKKEVTDIWQREKQHESLLAERQQRSQLVEKQLRNLQEKLQRSDLLLERQQRRSDDKFACFFF